MGNEEQKITQQDLQEKTVAEQELTERDYLEKLVKNSEKQLFYARVRTAAAIVIAGVLAVCALMIVPQVLRTVDNANEIMAQASETITLADTAIESVTQMSASITGMGDNMDTFITENAESVAEIMEKIEAVDFEGLNKAIKDLGAVVKPLADFFKKF